MTLGKPVYNTSLYHVSLIHDAVAGEAPNWAVIHTEYNTVEQTTYVLPAAIHTCNILTEQLQDMTKPKLKAVEKEVH